MLRLTEIRLPLDHAPEAISAAILQRLGIPATDLIHFTIHKRSYDARKSSAIILTYIIDVEVKIIALDLRAS
jgi:hypothetical protein